MLDLETQITLSIEIFTHPHNLQIRVTHTGKLRAQRSYGFCIKAGNGKQICSDFFGNSKQEVISAIFTNLSNVMNEGRDLLQQRKKDYPQFFDEDGRLTGAFLEQDTIDWVTQRLDGSSSSYADTSKMRSTKKAA